MKFLKCKFCKQTSDEHSGSQAPYREKRDDVLFKAPATK